MNLKHLTSEYDHWLKQKKFAEEQLDTVKKLITEQIEKHGDRDSKGSMQIEHDGFYYRKEKRTRMSLNEDNLTEVLVELGVYDNYIKKVLDEEKVEEGFKKGYIPEKYLDKVVDRKVSYAFTVRKKVDVEAEEESPV